MKYKLASLVVAVIGLFCSESRQLAATGPSFEVLAFPDNQPVSDFPTPQALSADGAVVVGQFGLQEAFRWTATDGLVGLSYISENVGYNESSANAVSADGSVIVGYSSSATSGSEAFRWTAASGMTSLNDSKGDHFFFEANGVSANGSTIVGDGIVKSNGLYFLEPLRWTRTEGIRSLGQLPGGDFPGSARAASYDGSVIVGYGGSPNSPIYGREAFRWTTKTGMTGLGDLPGDDFASIAEATSAGGSVIVGESWTEGSYHAFRWTQKAGMIDLTIDPSDASSAEGVSADGSRIVGYRWFFDPAIQEQRPVAFVWDAEHGMRDLNAVLRDEYGLDLQGLVLSEATAISADGSTIVGTTGGSYSWYGWVAHIPTPLDELIDRIEALAIINSQKADLLATVLKAKDLFTRGKCRQAIQQTNTFIRKVDNYVAKKVLTVSIGATLAADANSVIAQHPCN